MENPGKGMRALAREMSIAVSTMKLALNEDLRYYSYMSPKCLTEKAQELLTEKTQRIRLAKTKNS